MCTRPKNVGCMKDVGDDDVALKWSKRTPDKVPQHFSSHLLPTQLSPKLDIGLCHVLASGGARVQPPSESPSRTFPSHQAHPRFVIKRNKRQYITPAKLLAEEERVAKDEVEEEVEDLLGTKAAEMRSSQIRTSYRLHRTATTTIS
jgi:hypothetical protein